MKYKLNRIILLFLFLILFFNLIFAVNEIPNCCPSGINEQIIWNYLLKHNPNVGDDYKVKLKDKFESYYSIYNDKIEICKGGLNYHNIMYLNELEKNKEYNFGFGSSNFFDSNGISDESLNQEIVDRENLINYYIEMGYILNGGYDITDSLVQELKQFKEGEISKKLFNYAKISEDKIKSCYQKSIINTCYNPCKEEIKIKNDEILKQKESLIDEGKDNEAFNLEYLSYDICYSKCSLNQNKIIDEYDKIRNCSDKGVEEFKWIIPYLNNRKNALKMCNYLYKNQDKDFKDIFMGPIGGVIKNNFSKNNEINNKTFNGEKLIPSMIKLELWGKDLTEDMNYKLHISLDFFGKDKEGNQKAIPSYKIPKLKFKYELPNNLSKNVNLKLNYKIDSEYLKDSSSLEGEIWIEKCNLNGIINPIKVKVFVAEFPENYKIFKIYPRKRLKIISLSKITNQNAWDNSWSTYELKVNDSERGYLKYTIMSNSKNAKIYLNGFEYDKVGILRTKKEEIKFGWKAPKISKEARLNYAKHLESLTTNLAIKGGSEIIGNKLGKLNEIEAVSSLPNPLKIKSNFDNIMTGIGTYNEMKQINQGINGPKNGEDFSFYLSKNLVNGFINLEGYFGNYLEKSPIGLQYKLVSYGLVPIQEWYSMVDEMIKISQSKIISQNNKIIVRVENTHGDIDTAEFIVTVNGFERVLK